MSIDIITYLSGVSIAIYIIVCLLCGLQLCFGAFSQRHHRGTILSHTMGVCVLMMTISGVCYLLTELLPHAAWLYRVGTSMDIFTFIGYGVMGYALYTNNEPPIGKLLALASPIALCAILNLWYPDLMAIWFFVPAAILFTYFIYFGVALQRRERLLGDLYSDLESHSLQWIWTAIGLFAGWWMVSLLFQLQPLLAPWYQVAVFAYMTVLVLFVFKKVINYRQPVSLITQQEMEGEEAKGREGEEARGREGEEARGREGEMARELKELMEKEQLYLNPDLMVEDVVKALGTNTKYFSTMLHNEMHTTFFHWVNEYRVERAKYLLEHTDTKVEYIGERCGYNSRQSFHRVFVKMTGKTPAEWRDK